MAPHPDTARMADRKLPQSSGIVAHRLMTAKGSPKRKSRNSYGVRVAKWSALSGGRGAFTFLRTEQPGTGSLFGVLDVALPSPLSPKTAPVPLVSQHPGSLPVDMQGGSNHNP